MNSPEPGELCAPCIERRMAEKSGLCVACANEKLVSLEAENARLREALHVETACATWWREQHDAHCPNVVTCTRLPPEQRLATTTASTCEEQKR
jgi:hypothetical protein